MSADDCHQSQLASGKNQKRFLLVIVYIVLLLPWIAPAARRALLTNANSPLDWVDQRFKPRHKYDQFCADFGAADSIIISWPGCTVDDARLDDFVKTLRLAPAFQQQGQALFHHVVSGRELLAKLTAPPLRLDRSTAAARLTGSLIGPDGKTTCVVIGFTKQALQQRSRLVPLVYQAARKCCGVPYESQHLAGPIMDGYHVDQATQNTMQRMAPLSSLVVLLICFLCLDSIAATLLVFAVSLLCQAATLALVDLTGGTMTALMSVLAPLIQVLAIAGGIHYVNYYFDAQGARPGSADASQHAFRLAWLPCFLSSATTAIGLGSLAVSGLVAVRQFGIYAACGVLLTAVALLTMLPGFCLLRPIARPDLTSSKLSAAIWLRLSSWIERHSMAICSLAFLLMIGLGFGVSRLEASVRIETLFAANSRLIGDYEWIEEHVGALVPIEIVARVDHRGQAAGEQLRMLAEVREKLLEIPQVHGIVSPLTFLPSISPPGRNIHAEPLLAIVSRAADDFNLRKSDGDGGARWRTTAYVSALGDNDYLEIIDRIDQSLSGHRASQLEVSGLMPLVHNIQQQLLTDLFSSFLTAFALIAIVMTIVQAGILSGLVSMIPNVFPALILFGLLGWLQRPLDIGTIMTASVAMGIAVDDTLHFLTFYHRALEAGRSRSQAVGLAYQHCGRAMIQTTVICSGGLSLFVLSRFVPTAGFAWMSVLLLVAALIGDLIILPAVLLSPLGKLTVAAESGNSRELESDDIDFTQRNNGSKLRVFGKQPRPQFPPAMRKVS